MGSLLAQPVIRWFGALCAAILLVLAQGGAALADGGLAVTSDTSYEIVASEGLVRVEAEYVLKSTLRNEDDGYYITRYYYQTFTVPVPETAINLAATSGSSKLTIEVNESEDGFFRNAVIKLRRNLYSGQTDSINFSYDLPSEPVRSDRFARVNAAFSSFGMWGFGDVGQATVRVLIPDGFSIETVGDDLSYSVGPDGPMWIAKDIEDPDEWYVWVAARDDSALTATRLSVDDRSVVIRAWPDDPEWEQFAIDQFLDRLPIMQGLIGVAWPVEGELEIIETVTPSLYGAAGWFLTDHNVIEITEQLDEQVMLHELAHAWFSRNTLEHRWLSEGLAEELSYRTLEADGEPLGPFGVFPPDYEFPLNNWERFSTRQADGDDDMDTYGYDASAYVLRQVTREIGIDGLQRVLQAADAGDMAYPGEDGSDWSRPNLGSTDWMRFLDLTEQLGNSDEVAAIFERYVVTDGEADQLHGREKARVVYRELAAHGDAWAAPISVRVALEGWKFSRATDLMADAESVLELRDSIAREAIRQGVEPHSSLEDDYESAFHDVHWVIGKAQAQLAAVEAVADAGNAVTTERGIWASIGLWGADLDAGLAAVNATFESGDAEATMFQAIEVIAEVDAGKGVGMQRAGLGAAGMMLTLGFGLVGSRLLRRRRALTVLDALSEGSNSSDGLFEHPIFELEVEDFSSWVSRVQKPVDAGVNSSIDDVNPRRPD